jgi:hypothetical protein
MAKPANRKLTVFQTKLGFYETVVAAPSQPAALRAWGVHQNLFASGQAAIAEDAEAVKAALAHPETPLRRAIGSNDAFALEPTSLPKVPDAPKGKALAPPKSEAKPKARAKPLPDRSALDAAEAALKTLDEARKRQEAEFGDKQDALEAAREEAQAAYVAGRKAATAAVVEARGAYRKAGGTG